MIFEVSLYICTKGIPCYGLCGLCFQCLIKPAVKESTRPVDLKLHSDTRAVERAEFDQQVYCHCLGNIKWCPA